MHVSTFYRKTDDQIRMEIKAALWDTRGNVPDAASLLGVNRTHLYKLMQRFRIEPLRVGRGHRGNEQWQGLG